MFLSSLYQPKTIKNYENSLAKDLKDQSIGMNIKQKIRIDIFSNQTLYVLTDCSFQFIQKPKYVIYQKVLLRIITSSLTERTFILPINSDKKRYEENQQQEKVNIIL